MSDERRPAGIILSAGYSSRMGDFKPLMKIGQKTPLEILIDNLHIAGINDIFVVTGYNADVVNDFLKSFDVNIVFNENFDRGMFTSVQKGVRAAHDNDDGCFLLTPVDIPLIPPYIFKAVLNRYRSSPDSFVVPRFDGKKGHPLCIPAEMTAEILNFSGENGMKAITNAHSGSIIYVDTHCGGIVRDMDTQDAYRDVMDYYNKNKYPDEDKCEKILIRAGTPDHVVKHCMAVTHTAVAITEALNEKGRKNLSVPLVRAASMLHDVLRIRKKHWEEGANLVMDYGYPEVADIIMDHMNYVHPLPVEDVTEKDIVCLSDKLRQEESLVTLNERLAPILRRFRDDPEAVRDITAKVDAAEGVRHYIESVIDEDLYDMLKRYDEKNLENESYIKHGEKPRRVILIRHGETKKHSERIFLGQTDVPLDDEGREQCSVVGAKMQNFGLNTDVIYCSDLKRAHESAEIIAKILGGGFHTVDVPEFREMSLGSWDGMFMSGVKAKYPEKYEKRGEDLVNYRIDDTAENFYDVRDRVMPKLRELIETTGGDIVIVSHAGVNKVIKCELLGKELDEIPNMRFGRGTYEILEWKDIK